MTLYAEYEKELKSDDQFDPAMEFVTANPGLAIAGNATHNIATKLAFVESSERTDYAIINYEIFGTKLQNGAVQISANIVERGWRIE